MGNKDLSVASMTKLAKIANDAAASVEQHAFDAAQQAVVCGQALIAAKEKCPHGDWGQWLTDNFDYSQSTATRFMKLANSSRVTNLPDYKTVRQALIAVSEAQPKNDGSDEPAKQSERQVAREPEQAPDVIDADYTVVEDSAVERVDEILSQPIAGNVPQPAADKVEVRARKQLQERLRGVRLDLGNLGLGGVYESELMAIEMGAGLL